MLPRGRAFAWFRRRTIAARAGVIFQNLQASGIDLQNYNRREMEAIFAQTMLDKMVFLPFYPELPLDEAQRMAAIACRLCFSITFQENLSQVHS